MTFLKEKLSLDSLKHLHHGLQQWLEDGLSEQSLLESHFFRKFEIINNALRQV
ncbi:hypothetical protein WG904_15250 [Pedobacter sp. Du54]|uniref:hypothetical protein n=1 Tax=Pedobacter anseongensis TaxID=3133439 RepID=UPI00309840FE